MKTLRALLRLIVILLAVAFALPAQAWNDTGHMTVAELAWRNLSNAKRTAISNLLKQHPHYALLLATNAPAGVDTNEWVFLQAATWPDMVRPSFGAPHPKPAEITQYHHDKWHFINLPYVRPEATTKTFSTNVAATNILWALSNAVSILKDPHASPTNQAVSLCWLLHLVGDVHQPLHATMMFATNYPHGDGGGNAITVAEPGHQPVSLHQFWDELLGNGTGYKFISGLADGLDAGSTYDPVKMKDYKNHKTYASWATESFTAAEAFAYSDGALLFADWSDFTDKKIVAAAVPVLDASYVTNAEDMGRRRIALAGKRLANELKKLF